MAAVPPSVANRSNLPAGGLAAHISRSKYLRTTTSHRLSMRVRGGVGVGQDAAHQLGQEVGRGQAQLLFGVVQAGT